MKARRLRIAPEVFVMMFSRPDAWRVVKNRLPEDTKLSHVEYHIGANYSVAARAASMPCGEVFLWITSSVFRDDDPVDLPDIRFEAIRQ